jgi:hypothetical protein
MLCVVCSMSNRNLTSFDAVWSVVCSCTLVGALSAGVAVVVGVAIAVDICVAVAIAADIGIAGFWLLDAV